MFNKDFYPTPDQTILDSFQVANLDIENKVILEPSAGKGNAVDLFKKFNAKEVLACENNEDLAKIVSTKADRFLKSDFFDVREDEISHIDIIWMNPPFSDEENHILHAWDIMPEGCTLVSLCNYSILEFSHNRKQSKIKHLISENGLSQNLGDCFSTAERKTNINVGVIVLRKAKTKSDDEFDGYFDLEEEFQGETKEGLISHDTVLEYVNRYVGAVKMFDDVMEKNAQINALISPIAYGEHSFTFGVTKSRNYTRTSREEFKKELQKGAWKKVFNEMELDKYLTKKSMNLINKFVETQQHIPFTRKNIYKMFDVIVGTSGDRMKEVIIDVFDGITRTAWSERDEDNKNRYYLNDKWKTNSEYVVNKKFILGGSDFKMSYGGKAEASYYNDGNFFMDDLCKALCYVTGTPHNSIIPWRKWCDNYQLEEKEVFYKNDKGENCSYKNKETKSKGREFGKWYDFNFFTIKMYKKQTIHVKFKEDSVWLKFNKVAAEQKGFQLASTFEGNFRKKSTDIKVM